MPEIQRLVKMTFPNASITIDDMQNSEIYCAMYAPSITCLVIEKNYKSAVGSGRIDIIVVGGDE